MSALTTRQAQILEVIRSHVQAHGFPPTVREIGEAVGLKSTATVAHHLDDLEWAGYIERPPQWIRRSRAIRLVGREQQAIQRREEGGGR